MTSVVRRADTTRDDTRRPLQRRSREPYSKPFRHRVGAERARLRAGGPRAHWIGHASVAHHARNQELKDKARLTS